MDINREGLRLFQAKGDTDKNSNKEEKEFPDIRIVQITGSISEVTTQHVIKELEMLKQQNNNPIQMIINSRGGSAYDTLSIMEYMRTLGVPVYTKTTGYAFSGAAAIFSQGEKGHRVMCKNAFMMFHELSTDMSGKMHDLDSVYQQCKRLNDKIYSIVGQNCGLTTESEIGDFKKFLSSDCYLDAEQAKEIGFVDKII